MCECVDIIEHFLLVYSTNFNYDDDDDDDDIIK